MEKNNTWEGFLYENNRIRIKEMASRERLVEGHTRNSSGRKKGAPRNTY